MGVVIRQSFKSTVVTYVGVLLGAANLLYFFTAYLDPDEIGLRDVLLSVAMSLSIFTSLGLHSSMARFFPYFKDEQRQHNGYLLLCILIGGSGLLLFGGLFYLLRYYIMDIFDAKSAMVNEFLWLILPMTAFMMLQNILEIWARLHMRIVVNALIREILLRLIQTVLVVLYAQEYLSFDGFIIGFTASYAVVVLLLWLYIKKLGVLYINPSYLKWNSELMKNMARYSVWMMIGGAGIIINERIDGFMLAWLAGLSLAGIYSISFFIGTIIEMPRRAVSQLATTLVSQYWKDNDHTAIGKIYRQASLNQMILGGLLFLLVWANVDALFLIIPNGEIYQQGKYVVFFIGLSRFFDMSNGINSEIIINSPYFKFNFLSIAFLGLVSFATNYFMIPRFGLVGAAAGSTLSIVLFNLLKGIFIWKKIGMQPFEKRSGWVLVTLTIVYGCSLFIPAPGTEFLGIVVNVFLRSAFIVILLVYAIWRFKLSDEIIELMNRYLPRALQR
ncbi:MAG: oligosaccharide flippase family protein [Bacteroidia bacterium]